MRIQLFVREIWRWYAKHRRTLPWRDLAIRDETERAYRILVSEVMLQQTQVSRIKIVFKVFLKQFPKIEDLARASNREVLIAWRGLGYNNRALRLRDAAREIVDRFLGSSVARRTSYHATALPVSSCPTCSRRFPRCMRCLLSIKGIGPYTAAAIRNFAFGIPTPCLDTNIRRVLHRTFVGPENPDGTWKKDDKYLLKLAGEVLEVVVGNQEKIPRLQDSKTPRSRYLAADWHHALMDYGSLVLRGASGKPKRRKEPGRKVGRRFIPNRIFRGRIVEELRDAKRGLALPELGKRICLDWKCSEHEEWLRGVLVKLERDALIEQRKEKYILKP